MLGKKELRQMIKVYRNGLWPELVLEKSKPIQDRILASEEYKHAQKIFLYKSAHHETDTDQIITMALAQGKTVALPKIQNGIMEFFSIDGFEDLNKGYFGLFEPVADPAKSVTPDVGSLILVPGVAFDRKLGRCGYGKGFYDFWLAQFPHVFRAGIAFQEQLFDEIETDSYDIPMNRIYTDRETIGE